MGKRRRLARIIALVIQSIPTRKRDPVRLVVFFPLGEFDVTRDGVWFFAAKDVLDPLTGRGLLYYEFSHSHWTPWSHDVAGRAQADLIFSNGLLSGTALKREPGSASAPE
jgi:hypothetical protein